jgi:putative sporulation protein YyaC
MELWRPKLKTESQTFKIDHMDEHAVEQIASQLAKYLLEHAQRELVIVCVGTDRSTGDALGPIVGSKLKKLDPLGTHVYGTLDYPVHAMNLEETIDQVRANHPDAYVIAIDACLGQLNSVGHLQLCSGPLRPGAGVNKNLPPVGDIHLTGIVNVGGFMEYFVLQNTRLSLVMKLADIIVSSLYLAISLEYKKETAFSSEQQPQLY